MIDIIDYNKFNNDLDNYKLGHSNNLTYPLQIIYRGTGMTSKKEDFTLKYTEKICKKYLKYVLISGHKDRYIINDRLIPNYKLNKINYDYPILNFTSTPHEFLTNSKAKVYNKLKDYKISADKVTFCKAFQNQFFIPKTVYSINDIKQLNLPIIAKPKNGLSGLGIIKFESYDDVLKSEYQFDLFQEMKDISREFRVFIMDSNIIHISERVTNTNNNKSIGIKKINEKIDLVYIDQNINTFPFINIINKIKTQLQTKVKLDFFVIDLILDKNNKLWVPEINGAPGIGPSTFYFVYKAFVKMAYNKEISDSDELELRSIRDSYRENMKYKYYNEYKNSLDPI